MISPHRVIDRLQSTNMSAEVRFSKLELKLPPAPKAMGVYKPIVVFGKTAYLSGHGPLNDDGSLMTGRVGEDTDVEGGRAAARQTALALLATLRSHLGSLDRVRRVVKVLGLVNCTPDFADHPLVINGCSELLRDVFGEEAGVGARSAIGAGSLPGGITTEIEAIFEIE